MMGISCDECFADVTGLPVDAERLGELRASILRETGGCTASVGIGPNRLLARLATARAKPDGLLRLRAADAAELLRDEPVRTLPDCGHDREEKLGAIGIATCGDLVAADASRLRKAVGPKVAEKLLAYARGGDPRPWEPRPERKSVGAQASWGVRFESDDGAEKFCRDLARQVAERMRQGAAVKGRSLTLKLWRAMRDAPAGMSKGHLGHGLCDILNRSVALPARPPTTPTCCSARPSQCCAPRRAARRGARHGHPGDQARGRGWWRAAARATTTKTSRRSALRRSATRATTAAATAAASGRPPRSSRERSRRPPRPGARRAGTAAAGRSASTGAALAL